MTPAVNQDFTSARAIWRYYQLMVESLECLQRAVLSNQPLFPSFSGYLAEEVDEEFARARSELDDEVTLALVSSFESELRIDYLWRRRRKRRSAITAAFSRLHRRFGDRPRLEDILDAWKAAVGRAREIGEFKQVLNYRHWLAHGRYWIQDSGVSPDPYSALQVGESLLRVLPGFEGLEGGTGR